MSAWDGIDIEAAIREFFERNLLELQVEGGYPLAPEVKVSALDQVLLYWRRLRDIATRVTDTEVRLSLPGQVTSAGRNFTIEGVVDIVREHGKTTLYDIKTHDRDTIVASIDEYERQLNVYAHIWMQLRGEPLDDTAIICTAIPPALDAARKMGDEEAVARELVEWQPVINVPFSAGHVEHTIDGFADVVDAIEERQFSPPPVEVLRGTLAGSPRIFAVAICRNCDARFSCASYRTYATSSSARTPERGFRQYIEDVGTETDREDFVVAALDEGVASSPDELL